MPTKSIWAHLLRPVVTFVGFAPLFALILPALFLDDHYLHLQNRGMAVYMTLVIAVGVLLSLPLIFGLLRWLGLDPIQGRANILRKTAPTARTGQSLED